MLLLRFGRHLGSRELWNVDTVLVPVMSLITFQIEHTLPFLQSTVALEDTVELEELEAVLPSVEKSFYRAYSLLVLVELREHPLHLGETSEVNSVAVPAQEAE